METTTLKYFLEVAKVENIQRAARSSHVAPSTLSKALAKLEDELGVKLFSRQGRHIQLTEQGRFLQRRAMKIVELEESTRASLNGQRHSAKVTLIGQEIFLSQKGVELSKEFAQTLPKARLEFVPAATDEAAIQAVADGQAHVALTTQTPPSPLFYTDVDEISFVTCVGESHPLYDRAARSEAMEVEELLQYPFATPFQPFSSKRRGQRSPDGWRDDKYPRQIRFVSSSLKTVEKLVRTGQALAYLPDSLAEKLTMETIQLKGNKYCNRQSIKLVTTDPSQLQFLNRDHSIETSSKYVAGHAL